MRAQPHFNTEGENIHLRVADLARSFQFYVSVTSALGKCDLVEEGEGYFHVDDLMVEGDTAVPSAPVHFTFKAPDRAAVERFHTAGLVAGGSDYGVPVLDGRGYAALLLDPDGNTVSAIYRGPGISSMLAQDAHVNASLAIRSTGPSATTAPASSAALGMP